MKKSLLFSLIAVAAISANAAGNEYAMVKEAPATLPFSPVKMSLNADAAQLKAPFVQKSISTYADGDLSASYLTPGFFYIGLNLDFQGYRTTFLSGPAYQDLTWTNTSTGATSYSWSYDNPADADAEEVGKLTSTSKDLTVNYPFMFWTAPVLTASNGASSEVYSYGDQLFLGGESSAFLGDYYGAAMFNLGDSNISGGAGMWELDDSQIISDEMYGKLCPADAKNLSLEGYGQIFSKPAGPYYMTTFWLGVFGTVAQGTTIEAEIYSISDDNVISSEPIATASYYAQTDFSAMNQTGMIQFQVASVDPATMLELPYVNVNSSILILIKDYDDANVNIAPVFYSVNREIFDAEGYDCSAIYYFQYDYEGEKGHVYVAPPYAFASQDGSSSDLVAMQMMTDATFGWLFPAEGAPVANNVITAPVDGGSIVVPFESYTYSDYIVVEEDFYGDGTISDWASYSWEDDETNGLSVLTITVDALPDGVEGRSCSCTLIPMGANSVELTINQGTTGITAVTTSAAKVSVEGGNFVVTAPEAINAATVYNVAGQAVAASEIAGTTTIDGSSLAKGVYIVRFNDGSSVKVVK